MEEDEMDDRFKKVLTDPRFKRLPMRKKKIKIDSRFEGMFDKRFNGEPLIDKRGRRIQNTKNDGLKKFYEIREDGKESKPSVSDISRKLRGEDNDEDSSSSDESSSEEDDESDKGEKEDGEEDGEGKNSTIDLLDSTEVPRSDEITCRLAITNVDWDRLKAVDLFVLLNSFKPSEGEIISVKIYPSQFGKERMEKEKLEGPKELTDVKLDDEEEDPYESTVQDADEIINLDAPFVSEKLRKYQINRLKYFYAVVECDKPETAVTLYDQLDGMEYESSASTFDCRFIPEDMSFDEDEPDSVCNEMPSLIDYNPPNFITTALQQTKVNLTWDETDPQRAKTLQRAFTERDKISDDLACYLASSSSEDEDDADDDFDDHVESSEEDNISLEGKSVQDRIKKYKDLLKTVEEEETGEDEKDIDMEIKWKPELENIGKKILDKKKTESMTVFEKKMAERKGKKKKISKKEDDSEEDNGEAENYEENSEDYDSEDDQSGKEDEQSDENNESDEDNSDENSVKDEQGVDEDDLALLVMDNEKKEKKHFNYEDFVENKKSRRKKKRKEKPKQEEDNFQFDEDDPRFNAIYNSHLYNIDQSSSHFKKTQAYDKILKRKSSKDPDQRYNVKRSK